MKNVFCTRGLRALSIAAIMTMGLIFGAACGENGGGSTCEDNESFAAQPNGPNECLQHCDDETACPAGYECDNRSPQRLCIAVPDEENQNQNQTNQNQTNQNQNQEELTDEQLCMDNCYLYYGCILDACDSSQLNAGAINDITQLCIYGDPNDPADNGCVGQVADPQTRQAYIDETYDDNGNRVSCDVTEWVRCGIFDFGSTCSCQAPVTIGDACSDESQCDEGSLFSGCATGEGFPGGYCIAGPCAPEYIGEGQQRQPVAGLDGGCGGANICLPGGTSQLDHFCVQSCDSTTTCRDGYSCQITGPLYESFVIGAGTPDARLEVQQVGGAQACLAACSTAADCSTNNPDDWRCTDTGVCQFVCDDEDAEDECESYNGTCTDDGDGTEYCVLP